MYIDAGVACHSFYCDSSFLAYFLCFPPVENLLSKIFADFLSLFYDYGASFLPCPYLYHVIPLVPAMTTLPLCSRLCSPRTLIAFQTETRQAGANVFVETINFVLALSIRAIQISAVILKGSFRAISDPREVERSRSKLLGFSTQWSRYGSSRDPPRANLKYLKEMQTAVPCPAKVNAELFWEILFG